MLQLSDLVLEVTRKCNLQCSHCLRGPVQRKTMSREVLHAALTRVESIGTLVLTGGEPSLAAEVIEDLVQILMWQKISVNYFYIVSNGMNHNGYRRFLTAVERLSQMCDDREACTLTISRDQFHPFDLNPHKYIGKFYIKDENNIEYGEFPPYFRPDDRKHHIERVLNEGRATETQCGFEEPEQQKPWEMSRVDVGSDYVVDPMVYISSNGNVVANCNMSFCRIDREAKGNVLQKPLPEILESYSTREEEKEIVNAA